MGASIYTRTGKEKGRKRVLVDTWAHDLSNKNLLLHLLHPGKNQTYLERRALLGEFKERFSVSFADFQAGKKRDKVLDHPWLSGFKLGQEL